MARPLLRVAARFDKSDDSIVLRDVLANGEPLSPRSEIFRDCFVAFVLA